MARHHGERCDTRAYRRQARCACGRADEHRDDERDAERVGGAAVAPLGVVRDAQHEGDDVEVRA